MAGTAKEPIWPENPATPGGGPRALRAHELQLPEQYADIHPLFVTHSPSDCQNTHIDPARLLHAAKYIHSPILTSDDREAAAANATLLSVRPFVETPPGVGAMEEDGTPGNREDRTPKVD